MSANDSNNVNDDDEEGYGGSDGDSDDNIEYNTMAAEIISSMGVQERSDWERRRFERHRARWPHQEDFLRSDVAEVNRAMARFELIRDLRASRRLVEDLQKRLADEIKGSRQILEGAEEEARRQRRALENEAMEVRGDLRNSQDLQLEQERRRQHEERRQQELNRILFNQTTFLHTT